MSTRSFFRSACGSFSAVHSYFNPLAATSRVLRLRLEPLEERTLLAVFVSPAGLDWQVLGPQANYDHPDVDHGGSLFGGSGEGIGSETPETDDDNAVSGAIQTLVVHPTNPNIAYVGTVNGGIWKTTNLQDRTPGNPRINWVPLTDQLPSLSIGALALSPLDPNVIYAGAGSFSSAARLGGPAVGLLRSDDGGIHWRLLSPETFNLAANGIDEDGDGRFDLGDDDGDGLIDEADEDLKIAAVVPTNDPFDGQTVLVATSTYRSSSNGGLFVSRDRGNSFEPRSGVAGSGLPLGATTDLIADPRPTATQVYYAAVAHSGFDSTKGIYRSVNAGDTWQRIDQQIVNAFDPAVDGPFEFVSHIELTARHYPASGISVMYAALHRGGEFVGIFRSENFFANPASVTWSEMEIPAQTELVNGTPTVFELNVGRQGDVHFSMAASPSNEFVVFVGGDRQPGPKDGVAFPNSVGAQAYSGQLFQGNASFPSNQWTPIVANFANGTSPHADSRDMVWSVDITGATVLLEVNDGGIYQLRNPGAFNQRWESLNGNLGILEAQSAALDLANGRLLVAAQDNGTAVSSSVISTDLAANDRIFSSILGGDGGVVEAVPLGGPGQNVNWYYTSQNFGNFLRLEFVNGVSNTVFVGLQISGQPGVTLTQKNAAGAFTYDTTIPFTPQYAVNKANPNRMVIGTNFLYESFDKGDTLEPLLDWSAQAFDDIDNNRDGLEDEAGEGTITALAYGFRPRIAADSPGPAEVEDVLYVGTDAGSMFLRPPGETTFYDLGLENVPIPGQALHPTLANERLPIVDIVISDLTPYQIYVIDKLNVYSGRWITSQKTMVWEVITGNLRDPGLNTIDVFVPADVFTGSGSQPIVLVGGLGGVYRRTFRSGAEPYWSELGNGLPNAPVRDLRFYLGPDGADGILIAATLGRGVWALKTHDFPFTELVAEESIMVVRPDANQPNVFTLVRDADNPLLLQVFVKSGSGPNVLQSDSYALSSLERIFVMGGSDDDDLIIDNSFGPISVPRGIQFVGGSGLDQVFIDGIEVVDDSMPINVGTGASGTGDTSDGEGAILRVGDPNAPGSGDGGLFHHSMSGGEVVFDTLPDPNNPRLSAYEALIHGTAFRVELEGVEALTDLNFADGLRIVGSDDANTIQLDNGSVDGDGRLGITIAAATVMPRLEFANKRRLVIETGRSEADLGDTINLFQTETADELVAIFIDSGAGADTINVQSALVPTTIRSGSGLDQIHLGSRVPAGSRLDSLVETVTVDGGGDARLVLNAAADPESRTGSLSATEVSGLGLGAAVQYEQIAELEITLGSGNDTVSVFGTGAANTRVNMGNGADQVNVFTTSQPLTIDTGFGNDIVSVGSIATALGRRLATIGAGLTILGGAGTDSLTLVDSGNLFRSSGLLTATALSGLGLGGPVTYSQFNALTVLLGSGGADLNVQSTHAGSSTITARDANDTFNVRAISGRTAINTGGGDDTVYVGGLDPRLQGTLNLIAAELTVAASLGRDTLILSDSADRADNTGAVTNSAVSGLGLALPLRHSGVESIEVRLGSGHDSLDGSRTSIPLRLFGGNGNEVLSGGSGNDFISGENGNDTLLGNDGDDTLLGGDGDDRLDGGRGRNFLDGGSGRDGILYHGTDGDDVIHLGFDFEPHEGFEGATLEDILSGTPHHDFVLFTLNGEVLRDQYAGGEVLFVFAGDGDDFVDVNPVTGAHWEVELHGEDGNDHLVGGALNDFLVGGLGDDILEGGLGENLLQGGAGRDIFRDGLASDRRPEDHLQLLATGTGAGGGPHVVVFDPTTTTPRFDFFAYDHNFAGGVRVATGDVNADGVQDIITVPGAGGGPHVRVFDGLTGEQLPGPIGSFFAYDPFFAGGVFLASGDLDGDGRAEIITAPGAGGGPHVRVFSGADGSVLGEFFAFDARFTGGVHLAVGDVDGDGSMEIVTAAGAGGGPHVRAFTSPHGAPLDGPLGSFFAYQSDFSGGVHIAAGDVDGDGRADIVTGAGAGGGPHVRAFGGRDGREMAGFFAYTAHFNGGVRLATGDFDGDGRAEIITAAGAGGGPHVRIFDALLGAELGGLFAYDGGFSGGVYVAGTTSPASVAALLAADHLFAATAVLEPLDHAAPATSDLLKGVGGLAVSHQNLKQVDRASLAALETTPFADEVLPLPAVSTPHADIDPRTVVLQEFGDPAELPNGSFGRPDPLALDWVETDLVKRPSIDFVDRLFDTSWQS